MSFQYTSSNSCVTVLPDVPELMLPGKVLMPSKTSGLAVADGVIVRSALLTADFKAAAKLAASAKRSSLLLAKALATTASSAGGRAPMIRLGGIGSSLTILETMSR